MEIVFYISLAFIVFQASNVLINFLFREKLARTSSSDGELISILIPARNEEKNISKLLESLLKIEHANVEILVLDDHSTDNTSQIVEAYCLKDARIKLHKSAELKSDWLGKNFACHQLSQLAHGKYFLFVDADVQLNGNIVQDSVQYLKKHKLALLSAFPVQKQISFGEKISVPIMNYILLTLLPLVFVRLSPFNAHAAANGQFMLFDATCYKQHLPHLVFKKSAVEDIKIAQYYKKNRLKIACIIGEDRIECRMYHSYKEALNGFSKNIFMFFCNVPMLALLFFILASLGFMAVLGHNVEIVLSYFIAVLFIQVFYALTCKQNVVYTLLLFPLHLFFMLHVMLNGYVSRKKKNYIWKERSVC